MYKTQSPDTSEAAERVQFEILRGKSYAEKARLMTDLTLAVQRLAFAALREQYPEAPDDEIWLRLAVRRLGADTVRRVYGIVPSDAGPGGE